MAPSRHDSIAQFRESVMLRPLVATTALLTITTTAHADTPAYAWLGETVPKAVAAKLRACPYLKSLTVGAPKPIEQDEANSETGVFRVIFSNNAVLYGATCDLGASNAWWAAVLVNGKHATRLRFPMVGDSGKLELQDQVGGLSWDADKAMLTSGLLTGCAGANSVIARFKLSGKRLDLTHQEATNAGENCDKPVTTVVFPKAKK